MEVCTWETLDQLSSTAVCVGSLCVLECFQFKANVFQSNQKYEYYCTSSGAAERPWAVHIQIMRLYVVASFTQWGRLMLQGC